MLRGLCCRVCEPQLPYVVAVAGVTLCIVPMITDILAASWGSSCLCYVSSLAVISLSFSSAFTLYACILPISFKKHFSCKLVSCVEQVLQGFMITLAAAVLTYGYRIVHSDCSSLLTTSDNQCGNRYSSLRGIEHQQPRRNWLAIVGI
jgi:hypothetical protein